MRKRQQGISYSIVPFGSTRQLFLVGEPAENYLYCGDTQGHGETVPDYPKQIRNLLESCHAVCQKEGFAKNAPLMCQFFIADIGKQELVRQIASEVFPHDPGAVTFVPQPPASGKVIAVEIWGMAAHEKGTKIVCTTPNPEQVTVIEFDQMRWFFAGNMRPGPQPLGAYARSLDAFKQLGKQLDKNKFHLDQLVRTWIYQGHLVLPEGETQRYKELNRARTDYFGKTKFIKKYLPPTFKGDSYPASTGIGAEDMDVVIGGIAIATDRPDFRAVPLENPNQVSAFDYGAVYSPQSPKFSRAMTVTTSDACLIFISGTASITQSESRYQGDPAGQTEQTLDNIEALINGKNLAKHGIEGFRSELDNLESIRVYVKRRSELDIIREVCERRLGDAPILYTVADVCRPELLVEIEGFAVVNR